MKFANLAAVLLSVACSAALLGQWPAFGPTPDPNGPAPKARDGKPDFSGLWMAAGKGADKGNDKGDKGAGKGPDKGKDKGDKGAPPPAGAVPTGGFQNLGINFPDALLPYQPAALALRNQRLGRNSADHPDAHCLPLHPIQLWFHPQPRKWVQTPDFSVIIAEANGGIRHIFTDGRPLPANPQPWWFGYSTAKWEGDTLVIESTGFLDDSWIDEQGSPLSSKARVTERIRRPNHGSLDIEITVDDPATYTRPFTVSAPQRLLPAQELIEFICGENNTSLKHLVTK